MIYRRYGNTVHQVEPNFDSRAMTEVSFQRTGESLPAEEFFQTHERMSGHELTAEAEGYVQDEAEQEVLVRLRSRLDELLQQLGPSEVLLVESEQGKDYPKTRERSTNRLERGENRLHFHWSIDPPLRLGVYRPRTG